jgi:hypothetical protein
MDPLVTVLRLVHIGGGVYWAGTIFFFVTILQPAVQDLGPDGGKVMVKLFERGYLTILPIIATLTIASGFWLLWLFSAGFNATYMGSRLGIALSTGGLFATIAWIAGLLVMRPAAKRIWDIARELPTITDEKERADRLAQMGRLRTRASTSGQIIFGLLVGAVALMAIARFL